MKTLRDHLAEFPRGSELIREIEPVIFDFLVYRQEGLEPSQHAQVVIKFDPSNAPQKSPDGMIVLNQRIRDGVERWVKATDDGKRLYEYAGDDLNFGDLMPYAEDVAEYIDGCLSFSIESIEVSGHFTYDTSLCGIIEV